MIDRLRLALFSTALAGSIVVGLFRWYGLA
jgi:hypothetical protein